MQEVKTMSAAMGPLGAQPAMKSALVAGCMTTLGQRARDGVTDLRVEVEDVIAQGDQLVVRWNASGMHTGGGLGVAPTGRAVAFRGLSWIRTRDGKLLEGWQCSNIPEVLRGLTAPPA